MKVSINLLSKEEPGPVVVEVADSATVGELKMAIQEDEGISVRQQLAVFKRKKLEDNSQMLSEWSITDGSTVVILVTEQQADGIDVKVPLDRCFGLNEGYGLDPLGPADPQEGEFYKFKTVTSQKTSLLKVTSSGEEKVVFGECEWVSMTGEVLHFRGDGKHSTLVKGIGVRAGRESIEWSDVRKPDHSEAMKWLRLNFTQEEKVEVSGHNLDELNGIYTVEVDAAPALRYFRHGQPFGRYYRKVGTDRTLWPDREGNWCLAQEYRYNDTTGETGNLYSACPVFPWEAKFRGGVLVKLVED